MRDTPSFASGDATGGPRVCGPRVCDPRVSASLYPSTKTKIDEKDKKVAIEFLNSEFMVYLSL